MKTLTRERSNEIVSKLLEAPERITYVREEVEGVRLSFRNGPISFTFNGDELEGDFGERVIVDASSKLIKALRARVISALPGTMPQASIPSDIDPEQGIVAKRINDFLN